MFACYRDGIAGGGEVIDSRQINGLLSELEFRDFWVSWEDGTIAVGTGIIFYFISLHLYVHIDIVTY